jgi:hypothetical protein
MWVSVEDGGIDRRREHQKGVPKREREAYHIKYKFMQKI